MNFSALSFLKSLRIWHVAPLCLPFLLGSAKIQGSAPPTTPTAIAPPPFTVAQLLAQEGIFVSKSSALQPQLPSQALTAFTKGQLGSSQRYQSKQEPGQESEPVQQTQNLQTQNAQTAASVSSRHEAALALGEAPKPATNLPPIPLRVAIARNVDTVAIATSDAGVVTDQSGRVLGSLSPQTAVTAFPSNAGLQVGSWQTPSVVWVKPRSPNGLVYIGERWYRGSVQLLQVSGKVLAVNYVDLESYLYSVVGAEMPASWPAQALKAQAIAARSYAVVHMTRPAGDHYDLGATPRWQAYSGVESEAESTQLAVNATRGLLISYQGGVVESLYASTDQIVQEAHSGFGMSQNGANQLALKNFSYQQILSHFYPGTGLAVLNVK